MQHGDVPPHKVTVSMSYEWCRATMPVSLEVKQLSNECLSTRSYKEMANSHSVYLSFFISFALSVAIVSTPILQHWLCASPLFCSTLLIYVYWRVARFSNNFGYQFACQANCCLAKRTNCMAWWGGVMGRGESAPEDVLEQGCWGQTCIRAKKQSLPHSFPRLSKGNIHTHSVQCQETPDRQLLECLVFNFGS